MSKNYSGSLGKAFPVFIISVLALSLQFLQTRILSVLYWNHLVYFVVTLSLLGLAVSGTVLSVYRRINDVPEKDFLAICFSGFAVSSLLGMVFVTSFLGGLSTFSFGAATVLNLMAAYTAAMVPFVFFGLLVSRMFAHNPESSGVIYFSNLLGSAVGCLLYVVLIRRLGATGFILFAVFLPGALMAVLNYRESPVKRAGVVLAFAAIFLVGMNNTKIEPERNKQYWTMFKDRVVEFTEWNAISRVDVVSERGANFKRILIDGDAQTPMLPVLNGRRRVLGEAEVIVNSSNAWDFVAPGPGAPSDAPAFFNTGVVDDGIKGTVLHMNGFDSYALFPVGPGGGGAATLSFWVKPVPDDGLEGGALITLTGNAEEGFCGIRAVDKNTYALDCAGRVTQFDLPYDEWSNIIIEADYKESALRVFLNGDVEGLDLKDAPLAASSGIALGGAGVQGAGFLRAAFDEVAVWRRALTNEEKEHLAIFTDTRHREVGYKLIERRDPESVLVIGAGGGADVLAAYRNGARHIDAVEINPSTFRVVSGLYSDYLGDIYRKGIASIHLEDGRSFVRRSEKKYDFIMVFAVDSLAAISSGAYTMAESYLYTMEAFSDYWEHLESDGAMQISRWFYPQMPRESFRVFTMAYETLARKGVTEPFQNIAVISDDSDGSAPFADIIVSRSPFGEDEIENLQSYLGKKGLELVFNPLEAGRPGPRENAFYRFSDHYGLNGNADGFYSTYPFNVSPVTDDSPFFFQYGKWFHILKPYPKGSVYYESLQGRWPFLVITALLLQSVVFVSFLVLWPVFRLESRGKGAGRTRTVLYFAFLGLGFMFVEMFLIQRFVLILGHPVYSMAVVVPALLLSAGLGSFLSGKAGPRRNVSWVFPALCAMIIAFVLAVPLVSEALLVHSLTARVFSVVSLIIPLGMLMGIPFPSGMRNLSVNTSMIPVAWAVNGGMSVIGSVLAVIFAMSTGFSYVAVLSALLYAGALACFPRPPE